MLFKKIIPVIALLLSHTPLKAFANTLIFTGEYSVKELNEYSYLDFYLVLGSSNAKVYLRVYENNKLLSNTIYNTADLEYKDIPITPFTKPNSQRTIKIEVEYVSLKGGNIATSTFQIYSPTKQIVSNQTSYRSKNPIVTTFRSDGEVQYHYETFSFLSPYKTIELENKRIVPIENFYFSLTANTLARYPIPTEFNVDFELYADFRDSDLEVSDDDYFILHLKAKKRNDGYYAIKNEIQFFIDCLSGNIFINKNEYTTDDNYPFFIPFYILANTSIYYILTFKSIGFAQNQYVFTGSIQVKNNILGTEEDSKYFYEEKNEYFTEITYERG